MTKIKDSGIEWIGQIPEEWNISLIENEFKNRNEKVSDIEYQPLSVTKTSEGIVPQLEHAAKSDAHDDRKKVLINDFVINSRSDRRMSCGVSKYDGSVSLINLVLEPQGRLIPEYYHYLLKNQSFADEFYKYGHGIVADLWTTGWDEMRKIALPVPPKEEQKKIAKKIKDTEEGIDSLISIEEKQITELNSYKIDTITKAVSQGLNPLVKNKETGSTIIGEIPEDWNLARIKNYFSLRGRIGWDGLKSTDYVEEGPYLITGVDFDSGKINWNTCVHITKERFDEDEHIHVSEGDLLISKDGTIGKVAIARNCPKEVSLNSGVMLMRPIKDINVEYVRYVLLSNLFWRWYNTNQRGNSTIKHLYQEQFYYFSFPVMNAEEQGDIVKYLDEACKKIDDLIALKQKKIERLQEYKKSMIYEYVTGKKEVN